VRTQAIALCRVSTPEQRENNSLNRQEINVKDAAERLEVNILKYWSGDVSSRVGKNFKRKDLEEMFTYCKANHGVAYLIVDEVDRFMRDMETMFYWRARFRYELDVKIWFANDDRLNEDNSQGRLLVSLDGYKAEASNEERQRKSINGHIQALREGRYTFPPKPGYKHGTTPGVHVRNGELFTGFQNALRSMIAGLATPQQALITFNEVRIKADAAPWRIDKFSQFATDPYYAGVVEINKQVKMRNEHGLHEAMITLDEHEILASIFTGRAKPRGPRKQYNPDFPMSKLLLCSDCASKYTGAKKNNGNFRENGKHRKTINSYWKYTCRGCGKSYHRTDVHDALSERLDSIVYEGAQQDDFMKALETVWRSRQTDALAGIKTLERSLESLETMKSKLVRELATIDDEYKGDIKTEIDRIKQQISAAQTDIAERSTIDEDLVEFTKFGLEYTDKLASDWWNLDNEERVRCQQLIIPGGIYFGSSKKVDTPQISPIYRLRANKKSHKVTQNAYMVELAGTAPASVRRTVGILQA
jgi:DNA invertase Pin-like site-specific DNA recombinase